MVASFRLYGWFVYLLLVLTGYAFLQPAFEGFDENPHYSRILDASEDIGSQFSGKHAFRASVLNYPGPEAYASGEAPFSTPKTYDNFYLKAQDAASHVKSYRVGDYSDESSVKDNWQYQHPPLYYVLAGGLNRILLTDAVVVNVVMLRLFSVLLVGLGLIYCYKGLCRLRSKLGISVSSINSAIALFALCFPMFYFEFARLGNDALVFLLLSLAFYCSASAYQSSRPQNNLFYMSICLMFGLWTKAIVLPLLPMFAIYAICCLWHCYGGARKVLVARDFLWTYALPVMLGLGWYVFSYLKFNDLGLGSEARDLGQSTGLVQGLYANFDVVKFVRGLLVPWITFVYAGSWSLVRGPLGIYAALALIYGVILIKYVLHLSREPFRVIEWMPLGLVALLYAGLAYHVLLSMALSGLGTSGGWYLYVLTPWLLLTLCIAIDTTSPRLVKHAQLGGLVISAYLFIANALIYAGYVVKADNKGMKYVGESLASALPAAFERLGYVSYPWFAAVLFLVAIAVALMNMFQTR